MSAWRTNSTGYRLWWAHPALWPLLALASSAPFWMVSLPPLTDLLGHLGRFHVQLNLTRAPLLQKNWGFEWQLIGNLGTDLLIVPLAASFGLERAVWMIAMLLPPLFLWGIVRVERAVHGRAGVMSLIAAPLAFAYPFQYGFVNFWLASALALHGFAAWVNCRNAGYGAAATALRFIPIALLIWLAHLYGWAIFAVLVGAHEMAQRWSGNWRDWPNMVVEIFVRLLPILPPVILILLWRQSQGDVITTGFFRWSKKWEFLVGVLRDQYEILDKASAYFILLAILLAATSRAFKVNRGLWLATGIFLVLQIILPIQLQGSAYADARLWPVTLIIALLAFGGGNSLGKFKQVLASVALLVFVIRLGVDVTAFQRYDRTYKQHLAALNHVPPGSRIAVIAVLNCPVEWRQSRIDHLPALAMVRRDAFINSQWAIPGGQGLIPLAARGTAFNADPSQILNHRRNCSAPLPQLIAARAALIPRDRFDMLWIIDVDTRALPALPRAERVYSDDRTALYRLTGPGAPATSPASDRTRAPL